MRDNAATARALRADEYESRFLRPVEAPLGDREPQRRRGPRQRAYGTGQGRMPAMIVSGACAKPPCHPRGQGPTDAEKIAAYVSQVAGK